MSYPCAICGGGHTTGYCTQQQPNYAPTQTSVTYCARCKELESRLEAALNAEREHLSAFEAQHARATAEFDKRIDAERRLSAIREIVEPTGAYLFSGHVNALAEIRAIIVERQSPIARCPNCHEADDWHTVECAGKEHLSK